MLCVALSVVASSLFLCNKVLIKEPITQNPFRSIYSVLKYALKHKYARQRSAFTYCEDELPSRLDFGKSKYGGPFTTEQVEDVKTFFRVLGPVVITGFVLSMTDDGALKSHIFSYSLSPKGQQNTYRLVQCSYALMFTDIFFVVAMLLIPIQEIVIHPLFQRCLPHISCQWKVVLGVILQVVSYILKALFVTLSRHQIMELSIDKFTNKSILQCIFYNGSNFDSFTTIHIYRLYAITDVVSSIAFIMIFAGAFGFLCAQIPYSMKGAIVGLFYSSVVVFIALNAGIDTIFKATSSSWSGDTLFSCGFWYLQTKLILVFIGFLYLMLSSILYKKRKREDVLPNEHIFAERYYSKKLEQVNY